MIESLPTVAVAIGTAMGLSPAAARLIERLLGPSIDSYGKTFAEKVDARRNRVLERATAVVEENNIDAREIPLKLLVPILKQAELEDDTELSERWAALLTNATNGATPTLVHPRFPGILSQLSPSDAAFLDRLFETTRPSLWPRTAPYGRIRWGQPGASEEEQVTMLNLVSLGLAEWEPATDDELMPRKIARALGAHQRVRITKLGEQFVLACRMPTTGETESSKSDDTDSDSAE